MATNQLDSNLFWLFDNWPGVPTKVNEVPEDGFTGASHHNVATAKYDVGTKYQVYNKTLGVPGWSTFTYLQVGTQDATAIAIKSLCMPDSATLWYQVTNDYSGSVHTGMQSGMGAFALSAMTDAYYGWFWTGGVCPEDYLTTLGGYWITDTNVVAGPISGITNGAGSPIWVIGPYSTLDVYLGFSVGADLSS